MRFGQICVNRNLNWVSHKSALWYIDIRHYFCFLVVLAEDLCKYWQTVSDIVRNGIIPFSCKVAVEAQDKLYTTENRIILMRIVVLTDGFYLYALVLFHWYMDNHAIALLPEKHPRENKHEKQS